MPRDARAYLADILDSCDAISAALSGLDLEAYKANRLVRSSVEREFTITGERTVASTEAGHDELLAWARGLDPARISPSRTAATSREEPSAHPLPPASAWSACHPS